MTDLILEFLRDVFQENTILMTLTSILFLIIGFVGLIKGADLFVDGASQIAAKMKIPLIVIGLTIVAFGTSAPEAAISISASVQGNAGVSIGNVVGSNIMNILLILGISAMVAKIPVNKTTFRYEIPFVVVITAVLLLLGIIGGEIDRIDSLILIALFVLFFVYLIRLSKKGKASSVDIPKIDENACVPKMIFFVIIGLVMIVLGSQFTVTGATEIAKMLKVSERIIGLTVVAFGTSLPELVTSVTAARKGKTDIAVGNIIGSNIFNILFVVGSASLISPSPIAFDGAFIIDSIVAIAAAVLLWFLFLNKERRIGKVAGLVMLLSYAGYCVYLFI